MPELRVVGRARARPLSLLPKHIQVLLLHVASQTDELFREIGAGLQALVQYPLVKRRLQRIEQRGALALVFRQPALALLPNDKKKY